MHASLKIAPGIHQHPQWGDEIAALLVDYPAALEIPIAWGEQDAFGHVNNTVYIRQFESARIEYMRRAGLWANLRDIDAPSPAILSDSPEARIGPILASIYCRYKLPVTFPDSVIAAARVTDITADRFTMVHRTISLRHGRIAAEGEGVIVTYDYASARKAAVPEDMRTTIIAFEQGAQRG